MAILVTGAAGFIGFHCSLALLAAGEEVIGVDNLNSYYDVNLKKARLAVLRQNPRFSFHLADFSDKNAMADLFHGKKGITHVLHLGAQVGVRYSLENPFAYVESNVKGHLVILELCRNLPDLKLLVYASSSSVYGANDKIPFSEADRVDAPISLYAATKRMDELMSESYFRLYGLPAIGLRFFTVYGPYGRPDMAVFSFTKALFEGAPITVYDKGALKRDFTYIDDIVSGIMASLKSGVQVHRVYNLGNNNPVAVSELVSTLEDLTGRKALITHLPRPAADMEETFADISLAAQDLGFKPKTPLKEGLSKFVVWYRAFYENEKI